MKSKLNVRILGNVSPFSSAKNNCSGYLITNGIDKILLDCGFGVSKELNMPNDLNNLKIFISHFHKDHYADIFAIGYASYCFHKQGLLSQKVDLYIPKMLEEENGYIDYKLLKEFKEHYFNIIEYTDDSLIYINNFEFSFCPTKHSIKNYAINIMYRDKKISYSGDMGFDYLSDVCKFFVDTDLLICETTYLKSDGMIDNNHLNTEQLAKIAIGSNAKALYFTHTWPNYYRKLYFKELFIFLKKYRIKIYNNDKVISIL